MRPVGLSWDHRDRLGSFFHVLFSVFDCSDNSCISFSERFVDWASTDSFYPYCISYSLLYRIIIIMITDFREKLKPVAYALRMSQVGRVHCVYSGLSPRNRLAAA